MLILLKVNKSCGTIELTSVFHFKRRPLWSLFFFFFFWVGGRGWGSSWRSHFWAFPAMPEPILFTTLISILKYIFFNFDLRRAPFARCNLLIYDEGVFNYTNHCFANVVLKCFSTTPNPHSKKFRGSYIILVLTDGDNAAEKGRKWPLFWTLFSLCCAPVMAAFISTAQSRRGNNFEKAFRVWFLVFGT